MEYKGKVTKSDRANNDDKMPIPAGKESLWEVKKILVKEGVKNYKGELIDRLFVILEDTVTHNEAPISFRCDRINFSDDPKYRNPVIEVLTRLGRPLDPDKYPDWDEHFIISMKFYAQSKPVITETSQVLSKYKIDLKSIRPFKSSPAPQPDNSTLTPETALKQALLLAKGASTQTEALSYLTNPIHVAAFIASDRKGEIKYPIVG